MAENRYLVTGGAGNIGASLVTALVQRPGSLVVVVDDLSTGQLANLDAVRDQIVFIRADVNEINDLVPVFARYGFDYVFHYAAVVGVQRTLAHPGSVLRDISGIRNILDLSKNTGVKRVLYSSSSEVYGEPVEIPQREDTTPLNSRLTYAVVKNVGEAFCRAYYDEYGLPFTVFRFFNTYGPRQSRDFVIPRFIFLALTGQDIVVYGDGAQTRTFCYVDDNIQASLAALDHKGAINGILNIGSDQEISILALAETIVRLLDSSSSIVHAPRLPEGDMTRRVPDISRMRSMLSSEPVGLEQGVMRTAKYIESIAGSVLATSRQK